MNWTKFKFKCNYGQVPYILTRKLRSLRVIKPKIKEISIEEIHEHQMKAAKEENDRKIEIWKKEDETKLSRWTEWRMQEENRLTRRILPMPLSLTGFGDGAKPRYWSIKLRKALSKWAYHQKLEQLSFSEKIPISVKHLLENHADKIEVKYRPLCDILIQDKLRQEKIKKELLTEIKEKSKIQFPFQMFENLKKKINDEETDEVDSRPKFNSGLIDFDYENYLKHHHLLQHYASGLKNITLEDYEDELMAWGDIIWTRNYGTCDPEFPPSVIPCSGCGAFLHCTNNSIPGYMPSEKFKSLTKKELLKEVCQRCEFLETYNISIDVNVPTHYYSSLISKIHQSSGVVILMIDLLDFPASIWPNIIHLIGHKRKIYVVGNKVDLLPKDSVGYLERIENSLKQTLHIAGISAPIHYNHLCLISAKTGYGVEPLITRLLRDNNGKEHIWLIGCTNAGKSTLFNALLQSDLCKSRESDLIHRATTSLWPGTTMNLLKFPLAQLRGWQLRLRFERLMKDKKLKINENKLKRTLYRQTRNPQYALLSDRIGSTFREHVPFTFESGHPLAKKSSLSKAFDPNDKAFADCHFFHDTPGSFYKEQLLTLLTTEELLKTIPRETIVPRTFTLWPFQTLFIAGLARLDLIHSKSQIMITVFASHYLPVHVVFTDQAKQFYETFLGSSMLGVPIGGPERLDKWPIMIPKEVDFKSNSFQESCGDIVLSSAGWVSITMVPEGECVIKSFTPEGRGIFVRKPSLLPFAVNLRGKKIPKTPCFEATRFTVDEVGNDDYYHLNSRYSSSGKHVQMIQNSVKVKRDNKTGKVIPKKSN